MLVELKKNEVHVWNTLTTAFEIKNWKPGLVLSTYEQTRASRFKFEKDYKIYVTGRMMLRSVLARYLNCSPAKVDIKISAYGKPYLETALNFNLSHSGNRIVLACCLNHSIGIDIEHKKEMNDFIQIAKRFFSRNEFNQLIQLPSNQQLSAFYTCWTRKEAFIKAIGEGLSIPLDHFEVAFTPASKPELMHIDASLEESVSQWHLEPLAFKDNYEGALLIKNKTPSFNTFEWPQDFLYPKP